MSQLRDDVEYTSEWVREPQGRGTLSILYTCTFTLVLCVYTAIHLNIPPAGEPRKWQILRKIKWMFIAIFAPEAVLFTAIYQFWSAWTFCREMDLLRADLGGGVAARKKSWWERRPSCFKSRNEEDGATSVDASTPQPPEPFSITYGFYVIMGGLTVDVSDMHNYIKTVTLSPSCVLEMARSLKDWERFAVSDTTIQDKSKADTLAKSLVVLQVSWLFLQCVLRWSQGMPLTILEVHTLVHAACAMIMYGLWFDKPLSIRDATAVDLSGFPNEIAWELINMPGSVTPTFAMNGLRLVPRVNSFSKRCGSQLNAPSLRALVGLLPRISEGEAIHFNGQKLRVGDPELDLEEQDYEVFPPAKQTVCETRISVPDTTHKEATRQQGIDYVCNLFPRQFLRCGWRLNSHIIWEDLGWNIISYSLTVKDVLRWKRATKAFLQQGIGRPLQESRNGSITPELHFDILRTNRTISLRSENFHWHTFRTTLSDDLVYTFYWLGLGLITTMYGAIHVALWRYAFPSTIEMLLWKISSCTMAVSLFFAAGVFIPVYLADRDWFSEMWGGVFFISFGPLLGAYILLYILARVFIVVESFLSLRLVPVGVYEGITWADYIPHL